MSTIWNGEHFSIYNSDEKTVLKLIQGLYQLIEDSGRVDLIGIDLKTKGIISLDEFKKFNGEVDDTQRFKRAIETVKTKGGTLRIPTGEVVISETIILPSNIQIEGEIKGDNNNSDFIRNSSIIWRGGDTPLFTTEGYLNPTTPSNKITLKNLFICDRATVKRQNYYVVDLFNLSYSQIKDCSFDPINDENLVDSSSLNGVAFRKKSEFTDNSFVNRFENNKLQGGELYIDSTDSFVKDNLLWGSVNATRQTRCAIEVNRGYNTFITNNEIVGKMILTNTDGLNILGNYFDSGFNDRLSEEIILSTDSISNCIIANNNFWHSRKEGIKANIITGSVITGNTFSQNDYYDRGYSDIEITQIESTTITANSFIRKSHFDTVSQTSKLNARVNLGKAISINKDTSDYWSQSVISSNTLVYTSQYINSIIPSTVLSKNNGSRLININYTDITSSPKNNDIIALSNNNVYVSHNSAWLRLTEMQLLSSNDDFNTMNVRGSYYYANVLDVANKPTEIINGNGILEVLVLNSNYLLQRLTMINTNSIYIRFKDNGVFNSWTKI